ncbi:hypothetical protein Mapa_000613 [Marchantia paleacea]|nr:hypothetical protein Mapa_000613 [Marchantia paleacea]
MVPTSLEAQKKGSPPIEASEHVVDRARAEGRESTRQHDGSMILGAGDRAPPFGARVRTSSAHRPMLSQSKNGIKTMQQ